MVRRGLAFVLLIGLAAGPGFARDGEERPFGPTPQKNFSHLHDDAEWVVRAFAAAEVAEAVGDFTAVVRTLQPIIDQKASREAPNDAAPYVAAVNGTAVYEGAWIVARHRIQALGAPGLEAYAREFGGTAEAMLADASTRRQPVVLRALADRFLGLPAGRRACLLLCDLAVGAGDLDAALGHLDDLEDLEAVSAETPEVLAPWRAARARRRAVLLARDPASRP
ncbi:MAG: hypothetical protein O2894_12235, partial [Planctomycetota bacterium]|nr:hypothetical protein [Planctomycetota bacterium]